ncbi:MAG: UXX-star (seleno)protein family 2 [Chloroflexota bacterium]|nr:UXX-star (seleno)protein family 2 [Chloroflexota bacterium]
MTLYTRPDCSYSDAQRADLRAKGIAFTEVDLARQPERVPEVEQLTGGERITPVMVEDGVVTVGFRGAG